MRAGRRVLKEPGAQRAPGMYKGRRVQQKPTAQQAVRLRPTLPVVILLALAVICGTVFAYMFHRTEDQSTTFTPAQVSCEVQETFKNNAKSSIKVTNTGNIDAYIRVRLVTYWVDSDGNVAAKSSPALSITPANDWIAGKDNTFYYPLPVAAGDTTPELLSSSITLVVDADGNRQVIDVFAEAIQAKPTTAVEEAWGVTLNGTTITGAP